MSVNPAAQPTQFIGDSPDSKRLLLKIDQVAPTPLPIQLVGETGVGKEVVAHRIHERSGRTGAFVPVDCAALSNSLVESELFGHVRGAFTGATRNREGLVWAARGGTFFLDEIGDLPLGAQTRLLRLLQEGTYRPVGTEQERKANIRVIGASWRDLREAVADGLFRKDLYHRLAVVEIKLTPLRERPEDLPALVEHFLHHAAEREGTFPKKLDHAVWHHLKTWPWPGNVRELRNVLEYAQAMAPGPQVTMEDLPKRMQTAPPILNDTSGVSMSPSIRTDLPYMEARRAWLDEFQLHYVSKLLNETNGNVSAAARAAGMDRRSIQRILGRIRNSAAMEPPPAESG